MLEGSSKPNANSTGRSKGCWRANAKENVALFVTPTHEIYQSNIPLPICGPSECIVHVRCTGICGTEIHFWKNGHIGDCVVEEDLILGHESSGEILEVGELVEGFQVGDRVSIEPGDSCWSCDTCISGRFSGTPPTNGTLARYISHPSSFLHKLPNNVPYSLGALVEPLSVALTGVYRSGLRVGQPALICGAGPIGILSLICAKAAGAYPICISDLSQFRLQRAKELGADYTVLVDDQSSSQNVANEIRQTMSAIYDGILPEIALECTGNVQSIYSAVYALRPGGTLMQIGNGKNEQMIPLQYMSMREIDFRCLFRYTRTWPTLLRMLDAKMLAGVEKTITHTFDTNETSKAFELASDISHNAVKVQITDYGM